MDYIAKICDGKTGDAHGTTPRLYQNKYRVESTRLKGRDYSDNGYYFITICTHRREWVLGNIVDGKMQLSAIGEIVLRVWKLTAMLNEILMKGVMLCDAIKNGCWFFQLLF